MCCHNYWEYLCLLLLLLLLEFQGCHYFFLKKIQYLNQTTHGRPTILWVLFEDSKTGQQWRLRYKNFYTLEIEQSWTPIFAVGQNFAVLNGKVLHKQFLLKPAGVRTVHSAQGCTYNEICIDMDTSDSKDLQKKENLAKVYLQLAHYISVSRVATLEGLQIINWNSHLNQCEF